MMGRVVLIWLWFGGVFYLLRGEIYLDLSVRALPEAVFVHARPLERLTVMVEKCE